MRNIVPNVDASITSFLDNADRYSLRVVEEKKPLNRIYEAAARIYRAERAGETLIFHVEGYPFRFISNIIPGRKQLYRIIGARSDEEAYSVIRSAEEAQGELLEGEFEHYFRPLKGSLETLPALKFYEKDGGLYITSSIFVACDNGVCNASIHRIMVRRDYAAVRVVPRHLYTLLKRSNGAINVAVVIGVDPRVMLASALSPPLGVFEFKVAAHLLGGSMRVCRTPLYGLPIPCGASMVVEARLGPDRAPEGPFTDLLGLYDSVRNEPVLYPEKIYVNKVYEPLMHVILPGGIEHMLMMGFPREAAIYAAVARAVPRVHKVRLTPAGGMWLHAVVSITKSHDGDGKTAGLAALGAHPSLKHVVVVDDDIDPDEEGSVEWAIATRFQADRGLVTVPYARGSTLDPSARDGLTYKLVIDATTPIRERERYIKPRIPGLDE